MSRLFPSCSEAARLLSEQCDNPLGPSARFGLRLHLALCAHCRRYSQQLRLLRSLVREYPEHLTQVEMPSRLREEIVRKLKNEP